MIDTDLDAGRGGSEPGDEPVYVHAPDVLCRTFGTTVMLRVRSGPGLLRLDGPSAALWSSLSSPRTLAASARSLADMFGVPDDDVRQDIDPVVEELVALGALQALRNAS